MDNFKIGLFVVIVVATVFTTTVASEKQQISCEEYSSMMTNVRSQVGSKEIRDNILELIGFVRPDNVFGAQLYDKCMDNEMENAKIHTAGAQAFKREYNMSVDDFEALAVHCKDFGNTPKQCRKDTCTVKTHPKYRSIDGRGNNLKNPEWGASGTPFSRFASKNYEDGIYSIKKSITGEDLPNPRLLVVELLMKAVRSPPPPISYNIDALLIILFATHDLHYQVPVQPKSTDKEIQCCSEDRREKLPRTLSNSACLPIEVSSDDPFYKNGNVGCLNMVRSQLGKYSHDVQAGEIVNQATAYLDLSLIYGNHESETKQVRLYKSGKLRMGKNNVLPVGPNGEYLKSMNRFILTPLASIWPALFSRNHNHLAERLADLNPHWKDEILFQEARRINIANFQFNLITAKSIEKVFGRPINANYSELRNVGTFLEFSFTYRGAHYYLPSDMLFLDENYNETLRVPHSDAIGRIDLLENHFDDALRGVANQAANVGPYSDEIVNRIGKTRKNGYGIDLIATDIQRGRDQGIPSFVDVRRKCKLQPEINSLDDFNKIFNKTNVDLLKKFYNSHEDVDFYVAGLLEAFQSVGWPLAGSTFGCVIGENYNNVMGGDIYYYTHRENPYRMTAEQIDAVNKFAVPNLFCTNSRIKETNKLWSITPNPNNTKIDCKNFPPMDLSAWKELQ